MTLSRRRFLTISTASCLAATGGGPATDTSPQPDAVVGAATGPTLGGARSGVQRWFGRALGADVAIALHGPDDITIPVLHRARRLLNDVESQFSLYDPNSALVRLNTTGYLDSPDPMFLDLMAAADDIHRHSGGMFDPSVQPLWRALADGGDIDRARAAIGWSRIRFGSDGVQLAKGQALTFNGIAQGFATDLVTACLQDAGLGQALVNIGEYRGLGGPWRLGLEDPVHGIMGQRVLRTGAIATSGPMALPLAGQGHILHETLRPHWSSVSVEADTATMADGFSTAMTLAHADQIRAMIAQHGIARVTLVDPAGDLISLTS